MSVTSARLKFADHDKSTNKDGTLLYWPASHVPKDVKFAVDSCPKTNKTTVTAQTNAVNYSSCDSGGDDVNYFIATLNNSGKLVCHSTELFRMFPQYGFKDTADSVSDLNEAVVLTKREQLEQLKEKFGSKKTQRDLGLFCVISFCFYLYIDFLNHSHSQ